ncbi:Pr6Pr family membrane protein [Microbacterium sp. CGR1]|uniref:Pr6Pr family membrane protein n=1 Tax=Microbacterium sp. CGR1 TaxID=1696072 RepID=UPI003DA432F1
MTTTPRPPRAISALRLLVGGAVAGILLYTYVLGIPRQGASLIDYFGYFTNLTSLLTAGILITSGVISLRARTVPSALTSARAVAVACMIIVGVVYNVLVPGTGSAPPWVSATLHTIFPLLLVLDWIFVADRSPLPWRRLWMVLPYPVLWLGVVLVRGATDGWVPYGFLLPEHGVASLAAHAAGLLVALLASGALVWAISRVRLPRPSRSSGARPAVSPRERGGDPTVA